MSRPHRPMALVGVLALMTALLSVSIFAPRAQADANSGVYYVDTARDDELDDPPVAGACSNDNPNSDCTLRQALLLANTDGKPSQIQFNIPADANIPEYGYNPAGYWTIKPTATLPALTEGGTQIIGIATSNIPQVIIDGSDLGASGGVGLILNSSDNVVTQMAVIGVVGNTTLTGIGIQITGQGVAANQIVGCYIGVNPQTKLAAPNQQVGVQIDTGALTNRIGSSNLPNVISGNGSPGSGRGILISAANQNVIQSNFIGVLPSDVNSVPLGNVGFGIEIANGVGNIIGGSASAQRNIISGNSLAGIVIGGAAATNNQISGNYVGVDRVGTTATPNGSHGIQIFNFAHGNTIQGTSGSRLVVSGNGGYGILLNGNGTDSNVVSSAYIGVNSGGSTATPNGLGGVRIEDNAESNQIGLAGAGNVISGNSGFGVSLGRTVSGFTQTNGNVIRANIIGLNFNATTSVPNQQGGVQVTASARNTIIGGLAGTEGNFISGNGPAAASTPSGIIVEATGVVSTTISGNLIGLRRSVSGGPATFAAGNTGGGVYVLPNAQQVQIGGSAAQANKIDFNLGNGVTVSAGAASISIRGNDVMTNTLGGISLTGVAAPVITHNRASDNLNGNGILVLNAADAQVNANIANGNKDAGGDIDGNGIAVATAPRAVVTGNTSNRNGRHGLAFVGIDAAKIEANITNLNANNGILIDPTSTRTTLRFNQVISNTLDGINLIATTPFTMTENTVNENKQSGLLLTGPATNSRVTGNQFRLNKANGILVTAPSLTSNITFTENLVDTNTDIGLLLTGNLQNILVERNTFLNNGTYGVQAGSASAPHPQRVKMDRNVFIGNGIPANAPQPVDPSLYGRGIVLTPKTVGAPGDPTNPNHDIDAPIGSSLMISQNGVFTGNVLVNGSNAACGTDCTIQMFLTNPAKLDGQGAEFLSEVKPDANGKFTAPIGFVPAQIALTATDKDGNTSEFAVFTAKPAVTITAPQTVSAKPGQTVTIQHTVTNTGNVAFTNLQLFADKDKEDWTATPEPQAPFSLAPGETKIVSVTVSLPVGPANSVAAGTNGKITLMVSSGLTENASVSQTVEDTVQVLESVVLSVSPGNTSGSGKPGTEVVYTHNVTNLGNTTATITYDAVTTVNGLPAPTWTTSVSPAPTITLAPGQSAGIAVSVTVSPSAQAGPPPTVAETKLTITPSTSSGVDASQIKEIVDTTTTTLNQLASLVPDRQGDSAATKTISFRHTIQNLSNGTATFKLSAVSSQGSQITFTTDTQGIEIVNGDTVTIPGGQQFSFLVNITVARHVLPGQKDLVTVVLTDSAGGPIGGASVQDTINITQGILLPRLYLPLVVRP